MRFTSSLIIISSLLSPYFFFFNDTATTEIYTLSLHDALPIYSTRDQYRRASYKAGVVAAAANINPGSRPGCIVFSATNYDEHVVGLVKAAAAAIEARFRKPFGNSVTFFTDATCSHAL